MKVRKGFVSNSSSSSYIIYGFPSEMLEDASCEKWNDVKNDHNRNYDDDLWNIVLCEDEVIGESLSYWSDGIENINLDVSPENLSRCKEKVKKIIKDSLGFDVPDEWFRLMGATLY